MGNVGIRSASDLRGHLCGRRSDSSRRKESLFGMNNQTAPLAKKARLGKAAPKWFEQWSAIYFFFCRSACGLMSGRGTNMCDLAIAAESEVELCCMSTPVATWPESDSMNGKVVPSTL